MSAMDLAESERDDLAELLRGLAPSQWEQPSLCAGWSVRDVVAHMLSYDEIGFTGAVSCFLRARGSFDRANALAMAAHDGSGPDELLALLDRCRRPRGLTSAFGGRIALVDAMVHQQDIRRPLGLPRVIPAQRLTTALDFARTAPPLGAPRRLRGLRLVATDLDWAGGAGDEVHAPGETLLLALAGRAVVADALGGPGAATLAARLG